LGTQSKRVGGSGCHAGHRQCQSTSPPHMPSDTDMVEIIQHASTQIDNEGNRSLPLDLQIESRPGRPEGCVSCWRLCGRHAPAPTFPFSGVDRKRRRRRRLAAAAVRRSDMCICVYIYIYIHVYVYISGRGQTTQIGSLTTHCRVS